MAVREEQEKAWELEKNSGWFVAAEEYMVVEWWEKVDLKNLIWSSCYFSLIFYLKVHSLLSFSLESREYGS